MIGQDATNSHCSDPVRTADSAVGSGELGVLDISSAPRSRVQPANPATLRDGGGEGQGDRTAERGEGEGAGTGSGSQCSDSPGGTGNDTGTGKRSGGSELTTKRAVESMRSITTKIMRLRKNDGKCDVA